MAELTDNQEKDMSAARDKLTEMLASNDRVAKHFLYWYAWFWAIASISYFFAVTFINLPEKGQHFADVILGFLLGTAVATIIGFFYGNSKE